jgi:hypothetical protein
MAGGRTGLTLQQQQQLQSRLRPGLLLQVRRQVRLQQQQAGRLGLVYSRALPRQLLPLVPPLLLLVTR